MTNEIDIIENTLFSVIDSGAIMTQRLGEGRMIPVLYLDYKDNPHFENLFVIHEHFPSGDVFSRWSRGKTDKYLLFLELKFVRPSSFTIIIKFQLSEQAFIVDSILKSKAAFLQSKKVFHKSVSDIISVPRIAVEIPSIINDWNKTRETIIEENFRKEGRSKKDAKKCSRIYWKELDKFRNFL